MQLSYPKNGKIFIYSIFFIFFLLGINIYKDYGLTLDDEWYQKNGELYYEYLKILFSNKFIDSENILENLSQKVTGDFSVLNHPVMFELFLAMLVNLLNINYSKEIYELSHLLNFIIFFISMIFFYNFVYKKFNSIYYSLAAIIILFFTPRIFAESFYNSRDIFFLSLFIIFIYSANNFLLNQNLKNSIYFSLTSALLINAKIMGIAPPLIFLFFYFLNSLSNNSEKNKCFKLIIFIIPTTLFFIYIFWPYLWMDPINNLINAFRDITQAHNTLVLQNLYFGEYISSTFTPWHYRIVWFLITTPVLILLFFFVGFILILSQIIKGLINLDKTNDNLWKSNDQMFNFYLFSTLVIIVFTVIKFNESQFGAWRHLYFLYPIIVTIALFGFQYVNKFFKNQKAKIVIFLFIGINLFYILFWNYKYHPHQQVYFNYISKYYDKRNFDLDYWGLSNLHSLKYILKNNANYPIKIGTISFSALRISALMLDEESKKNIFLVGDLHNADFLISNYMKRFRNNFVIDEKKYVKYFEIVVDGVPINTVYKKIN